jgi:hypothetical protein
VYIPLVKVRGRARGGKRESREESYRRAIGEREEKESERRARGEREESERVK